jgi:outer membrane immunogenic protein
MEAAVNRVALISTLIMGVGFAHGALAADLPVRAAPVYQAPVVVAPTWTGLYVGANGGWGWASNFNASSTFTDPTGGGVAISPAASNLNATGAVFGGQLGYNWQTGSWVWGVEGDFDGSNINKLNNVGETILAGGGGPPGTTASFYANVNWLATIRGRLGYAWGPGMIYVTGGGAWASVDFNAGGPANDFVFSSTSTKSGWTIGAGYEWLINPNWSVRAEYLYYKFTSGTSGTVNAGGVAPAGTFTTHSIGNFDVNVVRLGLNYKLDWWR